MSYSFTLPQLKINSASQVNAYDGSTDEIVFNHSGNLGDILFSLHFVKEFCAAKKIKHPGFNLRINQRANYSQEHPNGNLLMTEKAAVFLKPLLDEIFAPVTVSPDLPDNFYNLDKVRKLNINFFCGDIRTWYYNLSPEHLPQDFETPLFVPEKDERFKNKVVLIYTSRYRNVFIDYDFLKRYQEQLVFFGLPEEYESFCKNHFELEFYRLNDAKETAGLMAGAKGIIGNPSGLYTIAECMKIPRVLLTPEYMRYDNGAVMGGPVNVHPRGGWFEVAQTDDKFRISVDNLMNL